jgi:hypothetical protein
VKEVDNDVFWGQPTLSALAWILLFDFGIGSLGHLCHTPMITNGLGSCQWIPQRERGCQDGSKIGMENQTRCMLNACKLDA